ncbi:MULTISPECIES: hypothetical protein [unclassified Streptomyces]
MPDESCAGAAVGQILTIADGGHHGVPGFARLPHLTLAGQTN